MSSTHGTVFAGADLGLLALHEAYGNIAVGHNFKTHELNSATFSLSTERRASFPSEAPKCDRERERHASISTDISGRCGPCGSSPRSRTTRSNAASKRSDVRFSLGV